MNLRTRIGKSVLILAVCLAISLPTMAQQGHKMALYQYLLDNVWDPWHIWILGYQFAMTIVIRRLGWLEKKCFGSAGVCGAVLNWKSCLWLTGVFLAGCSMMIGTAITVICKRDAFGSGGLLLIEHCCRISFLELYFGLSKKAVQDFITLYKKKKKIILTPNG